MLKRRADEENATSESEEETLPVKKSRSEVICVVDDAASEGESSDAAEGDEEDLLDDFHACLRRRVPQACSRALVLGKCNYEETVDTIHDVAPNCRVEQPPTGVSLREFVTQSNQMYDAVVVFYAGPLNDRSRNEILHVLRSKTLSRNGLFVITLQQETLGDTANVTQFLYNEVQPLWPGSMIREMVHTDKYWSYFLHCP